MADGMPLAELVERCRGRNGPDFVVSGSIDGSAVVTGITLRSDEVEPGWVFGAVRGLRADGHDFITDAVERGAVAVIAEEVRTGAAPTLVVERSPTLIGAAAAELFGNPSRALDLVGVTGTNGKTSIVTLIEHIATAAGRPARSMGTLSGSLTTAAAPDFQAALRRAVDDGVSVFAAEVSSHALDQSRVDGSEFRVAVFTNLSQDHLDYHGDMERYYRAKARLFTPELSQSAVIDVSDPAGARLVAEATIPTIAIDTAAVAGLELETSSSRFRWHDRLVELPLGGRFNVSNALLAAEVGRAIGIGVDEIVAALATAPQVPGRFEYVDAGQPFAVIVDYSHTPASLAVALAAIRDLEPQGSIIVVFGAAGDRDPGKRPLMGEAASAADHVVLTSDNPRTEDPVVIMDAVAEGITAADPVAIPDRREAIAYALTRARDGDVVLIAGKGHEDYQIVGSETRPFDDRVVSREVLAELGWGAAA